MNYQAMQFQAREKQQLFYKEAQRHREVYQADVESNPRASAGKLAAARAAAIVFLIATTTALFYIF